MLTLRLIRLIRKFFCNHDYRLLTSYKTDTDPSVGFAKQTVYTIYCPKCRKEKTVSEPEYNSIMARQQIDRECRENAKQTKRNKRS